MDGEDITLPPSRSGARLPPAHGQLHLPELQPVPARSPRWRTSSSAPTSAGRADAARWPPRRWRRSGWPTGPTTSPTSCPAASSSGWRSPGRWPPATRSCWPTSRPASWTSAPACRSSSCSGQQAAAGKTVLVVTHNREISRVADRVIELSSGTSSATGRRRRPGRHRRPALVGAMAAAACGCAGSLRDLRRRWLLVARDRAGHRPRHRHVRGAHRAPRTWRRQSNDAQLRAAAASTTCGSR